MADYMLSVVLQKLLTRFSLFTVNERNVNELQLHLQAWHTYYIVSSRFLGVVWMQMS